MDNGYEFDEKYGLAPNIKVEGRDIVFENNDDKEIFITEDEERQSLEEEAYVLQYLYDEKYPTYKKSYRQAVVVKGIVDFLDIDINK